MKKDIFSFVFNNKLLNTKIFNYVKYIHKDIYEQKNTFTWKTVSENLDLLAGNGYIDLLKQSLSVKRPYDYKIREMLTFTIKANNLELLKYLMDSYVLYKIDEKILCNSLCFKNNYRDILHVATEHGKWEIINYLDSLPIKWNYEESLKISPMSNNLEIVQFFYSKITKHHYGDYITIYVLESCGKIGNISIIEWVFSFYGGKVESDYGQLYENSVVYGHIHVLEWLLLNNIFYRRCLYNLFDVAASLNRFDILKWLHANSHHKELRQAVCSISAMDSAAGNGNLEILKWLHENRNEGCSKEAMNRAAGNGHLEIVKWLHNNRTEGCSPIAMNQAASCSLEIVIWLHENRTEGCTRFALDMAAIKGTVETLDWLYKNRTECNEIPLTNDLFMNVCYQSKNLEILDWLYRYILSTNLQTEFIPFLEEAMARIKTPLEKPVSTSVVEPFLQDSISNQIVENVIVPKKKSNIKHKIKNIFSYK